MVCFGHAVPGYALVFEQLPPAARVVDDALELLRCEVVSAQNEQDPTAESSQSLLHSVREWRFAGGRLADSPSQATVPKCIDGKSAEGARRLEKIEFAANQLMPQTRLKQPPQVIVPEMRARDPLLCAHPRVKQHQPAHPRILVRVKQSCRSRVAQAPYHDVLQAADTCEELVDRTADVHLHALERPHLAIAVSHPAVVESQRGNAALREMARHQRELSMASHPVLRPAHDDQHATPCRKPRSAQNPDKRFALAVKHERMLVRGHRQMTNPISTASTMAARPVVV